MGVLNLIACRPGFFSDKEQDQRKKRLDKDNNRIAEPFHSASPIVALVPLQQNFIFKLFLNEKHKDSLFGYDYGFKEKCWDPRYGIVNQFFYMILLCSTYWVVDVKEHTDFKFLKHNLYAFVGRLFSYTFRSKMIGRIQTVDYRKRGQLKKLRRQRGY